jgi:putative ABC transport system permease protein
MKYFRLIWAGLWRKKPRTIFTMLSIVVAFLLFGLLQGVNQGFKTVVQRLDIDRLYVQPKAGDGLPVSYLNRIKSVPGVTAIAHWNYFGGYYKSASNAIPAFATDPTELFNVYHQLKIKPEYLDAMQRIRTGAITSEALAKQYGWKIGDRIPLGTSIWTTKGGSSTWYFDLVGTFEAPPGFPSFFLNYSYFDEAAAFGNGMVHIVIVRFDDPSKAAQIADSIDKLFENSASETRTQTESAMMQSQLKQLGDINFIANAIVGAVLFTLLFLTANTMMQSVRERTAELAVLKTFGFSDGKVLVLILIEALLLCLFAAAIGLFLASAVFPAMKPIFGEFRMPMLVAGMGAGLAVMLALISGLPPAWRAGRLNIVDALAGR